MTFRTDPIDVWLKWDAEQIVRGDDDPLATYEANTFMTETGYEIQWYHNDVGLVTHIEFDTLADAYDWYERNGFQDFTA